MGVKQPVTVVFRAQDFPWKGTVPDLDIQSGNPFPENVDGPGAMKHFVHDAMAVVDALMASLPGGTIDQILIELLMRKASQLRVPTNAHH